MESKTSSCDRPISLGAACDGTNVHVHTNFETWGQFLGGLYLISTGMRMNSFTGGVISSFGSCLLYRGASCLLSATSDVRRSPKGAERPDPAVVNNPIDEASWESFPASDSPVFSGITK